MTHATDPAPIPTPAPDALAIIDTPEGINFFHFCQLKAALKIEVRTNSDLRHSKGSVLKAIKQQYGLTGNKREVLAKMQAIVDSTLGPPRPLR